MASVLIRRSKWNLWLLVLVLILAGGIWFWQQKQQQTLDSQGLLPLSINEVETLSIERRPSEPHYDVLAFERRSDEWWITEPHIMPANRIRVRQLLSLLEESVAADYAKEGHDLKRYGLEPGLIEVRFNRYLLRLGETNPVTGQRYVLSQERIKLVNESVFANLNSGWWEYVSLKLVPDHHLSTAEKADMALILPDGSQASELLLDAWQQAEAWRIEPLLDQSSQETKDASAFRLIFSQGGQPQEVVFWLGDFSNNQLVLDNTVTGLRYILSSHQAQRLIPMRDIEAFSDKVR